MFKKVKILDGWSYFLKLRMKEGKLSIRKLAEKANISSSYLSHVLKGDYNIPSNEILKKIAKELDIDEKEMLIMAGRIPEEEAYLTRLLLGMIKLSEKEKKCILDHVEGLVARNLVIKYEEEKTGPYGIVDILRIEKL